MKTKMIYLDNAAAAPPSPEVIRKMAEAEEHFFGNSSAVHRAGLQASREVESARQKIAERLNADAAEIYFCSGGTEANNWVLSERNIRPGEHVITSQIEHPSVLEPLRFLETLGVRVSYLPVEKDGRLEVRRVREAIRPETSLVTVMHANNELGALQPIEEIGAICRERGVLFHSDACQTFCKESIDVEAMNLDLLTINSPKIHGPKGVGALYMRKSVNLQPLLRGGGHEGGARSGTVNVAGAVGFAEAVRLFSEENNTKLRDLRKYLLKKMEVFEKTVTINGSSEFCVNNILNFRLAGIDGKKVFNELNKQGIILSLGSACSSTKLKASHVLAAIGLNEKEASESFRVSLNRYNTEEEIDVMVECLTKILKENLQNVG